MFHWFFYLFRRRYEATTQVYEEVIIFESKKQRRLRAGERQNAFESSAFKLRARPRTVLFKA